MPASDGLEQYSINQTTGALVPMSPSSIAVTSAGGLNPIVSGKVDGKNYVYMLSSLNNSADSLSLFSIGVTGALTLVNSLSLADNGATQIAVAGNHFYMVDVMSAIPKGGNGYNGSVFQYGIDPITGELIAQNTIPLGTQCMNGNMVIDPNGKYLYVSCQDGRGNRMLQYSVDSTTGVLNSIGNLTLEAKMLGSLTIDPTGSYLYLIDSSDLIWQYSISN